MIPEQPIEERLRAAGLPPLPRLCWLEIDEAALAGNVGVVRELVGPSVEIAAVVKADGYGHGLVAAARAFVAGGADRLCTATLDEALALRAAGIAAPIVVLFAIPASGGRDAVAARLELVAAGADALDAMLDACRGEWRGPDATSGEVGLRLHLEVETGLGRAGFDIASVPEAARRIGAAPGAGVIGLWSHLARAEDAATSGVQVARLEAAVTALAALGMGPPVRHMAASGALFAGSAPAFEMVRPGLALYGELPDDLTVAPRAREAAARLRPAMTLKARALRIADVPVGTPIGYGGRWVAARPSRVATLPVGYGDGWARVPATGRSALVRGRRVPLVGTVAMDAVAADVTDLPGVGPADEFVLLGAQDGERITAGELAQARTTISWEVLTSMAQRVPRVYHAGAGPTGIRTIAGAVVVGDDEPARRRP